MIGTYGPRGLPDGEINRERYARLATEAMRIHRNRWRPD